MNQVNNFKRLFTILGAILLAFISLGSFFYVVFGSNSLANPVILATNPVNGTHTAAISSSIVVTFDQPISPTTVNTGTFTVHDMQTGLLTETYGISGNQIFLDPDAFFWPGMLVEASVTTGTKNLLGENLLSPKVWRFRTAVYCGSSVYTDTLQSIGNSSSWHMAVGDLDNDNDLDVFVANGNDQPNKVWLNDGNGGFTDSGQNLGTRESLFVDLGDVDGDGDLDAMVANWQSKPNRLYLNDGDGNFTDSGQSLGTNSGTGVDLGDLDGDGDLDAVFVHGLGVTDKVWHNDGQGNFTMVQQLSATDGRRVELGDLDNDGDLDAFISTRFANVVWFNDGDGTFTDSGQSLGDYHSRGLGLGDLDGDGDLDAFVSNTTDSPPSDVSNRVWLNNGSGFFTDTGQTLGNSPSQKIGFGDVDADGDLDAYVANFGQPNKLWLNDGSGNFSDSGLSQGTANSMAVALGDFNGDGTLDAWVANRFGGNELWTNLNIPVTGLTATNDSPTMLGNSTTLTASTVSTATDVTFMWDFGDGQQGSGTVVSHVYPMPGVYTATVTVAKCDTIVQATTVVTILEAGTPTPTPSNTPTATPTSTNTPTPTPTRTPHPTATVPSPQTYKNYIPFLYHNHPLVTEGN